MAVAAAEGGCAAWRPSRRGRALARRDGRRGAPGSNGQCYFVRWFNEVDPTDGRFYLHVGSPLFGGGGRCVWAVNGHYEVSDPFPARGPARMHGTRLAYSPPRATNGN